MKANKIFASHHRHLLALLLVFGGSLSANATELEVTHAWATATMPAQPVAAVYMQLRSPVDAKLLGIESDVANPVQMHSMSMRGNVMHMQQVPEVDLPAGKIIIFSPGGLHVMLTNLQHPLKAGDSVRLRLMLEGAHGSKQSLLVTVPVIKRPVE